MRSSMVEQMSYTHHVAGSSPAASTRLLYRGPPPFVNIQGNPDISHFSSDQRYSADCRISGFLGEFLSLATGCLFALNFQQAGGGILTYSDFQIF